MSKLKVYLVGSIEAAVDWGANWRVSVTPLLERAGFEVLDPCKFEAEQLKGVALKPLPKRFVGVDGRYVEVKHWHDLRYAPQRSCLYQEYLKRIQHVIRFDMGIVREHADAILCLWCAATGKGAGSHAEVTGGFLKGIPVILVDAGNSHIPGWIRGCATWPRTTRSSIFGSLGEGVKALKNWRKKHE